MSSEKIRVIITDDHALCRTATRNLLAQKKDIEVVAEAEHGAQLLELLDQTHADVVTLGVSMPVMGGCATLPLLKRRFPSLRVIMLSMLDDPWMVRKTLELGANSYITKDAAGDEIYDAIRACHQGWFYLSSVIREAMAMLKPATGAGRATLITRQQVRIINLLSRQRSCVQIAAEMGLTPRFVDSVVSRLKHTMGARSEEELIMLAIKKELISEN